VNDTYAAKKLQTGIVGHKQSQALAQPSGIAEFGLPAWSQFLYDAGKECHMKDKWLLSKVDTLSLKYIVLWGAFASAVLAGLSGMRWTALAGFRSTNGEVGSKVEEQGAFDPFVLTTVAVTRQSEDSPATDVSQDTVSARVLKWPAIHIPYRPALRSPFQPPLVPPASSNGDTELPQATETTAEKSAI
jgi:hypothetical protein